LNLKTRYRVLKCGNSSFATKGRCHVTRTWSRTKTVPATVIEHVLERLKTIGISEVFGVAGGYAFPVEDAIVSFPEIEWVGCCNELNAA
jgi:hypothetical protein